AEDAAEFRAQQTPEEQQKIERFFQEVEWERSQRALEALYGSDAPGATPRTAPPQRPITPEMVDAGKMETLVGAPATTLPPPDAGTPTARIETGPAATAPTIRTGPEASAPTIRTG